jgi:hypothetical protein
MKTPVSFKQMSSQTASYDVASALVAVARPEAQVTNITVPQSRVTVTGFTNVEFLTGPASIRLTGPAGFFSSIVTLYSSGSQPLKIVLTGGPDVLRFPSGASAVTSFYTPLVVTMVSDTQLTASLSTSETATGAFSNTTGLILDAFTAGAPLTDQPLYIIFTINPQTVLLNTNTLFRVSQGNNPLTGSLANIYKINTLPTLAVGAGSARGNINLLTRFVNLGLSNGTGVNSQPLVSGNLTFTASNPSIMTVHSGAGYSIGESFVVPGPILGGPEGTSITIVITNISAAGVLTLAAFGSLGVDSLGSNILVLLEGNKAGYRDASDITRALKERIIYNEKRAGSPIFSGKGGSLVPGRPGVNPGSENNIPAGNAEMLWIPQGNQYRLSYLFGKLKCRAGFAGAFNLNGPLSSS